MTDVVGSDADLLDMLAWRDAGRSYGAIAVTMGRRLGRAVSRASVQGALRRIDHDLARSEGGHAAVRLNARLALGRERRARIEPLVRAGVSAPEIGVRLGLNVHTVKSQCRRIREAMTVEAEASARRQA
jgi:DNA-binding NarL/FixJ family response regulator